MNSRKKKGPVLAATSNEGQNQPTNQQAEGSVMETLPQTTDVHESPRPPIQAFAADEYDEARRAGSPEATDAHESLRHLFYADGEFDIRAAVPVPAMLPEGDALWIDQDTPRVEPAEAIGDNFFVIRVFDLHTGEQLNRGVKMGVDWWEQQMGDFDYARFGRMFPNTYLVNEGHLFVSGGMWMTEDHPDADGMGRFVSTYSLRAEENRRRTEWLEDHAEALEAVRPAWASENEMWLDMVGEDDAPDSIEFYRTVGAVRIEQAADVTDGVVTLLDSPEIRVTHQDEPEFTPENAARIGVDMVAAAAMLGAHATVSHVHDAVKASGVSYGVVLESLGV